MRQPILGKPSGITLKDHTQHVWEQFEQYLLPTHTFAQTKYHLFFGNDLAELTQMAIRWHDAGKCHNRWQAACRADFDEYCNWDAQGKVGKAPEGGHLMRSGIRHEMDSVRRLTLKHPNTSPIVLAAIAAHHGKLGARHELRWNTDDGGNFALLWTAFRQLSSTIKWPSDEAFTQALRRRYEYAGPRALLQLADHRASAAESKGLGSLYSFSPFKYDFPHAKPQGVQEKVKELWDDPLGLLRAPTGAGKTDAALIWARHQIEAGRADRLVIAMPTRFTANALSVSTASSLSEVGLYHSTSWYRPNAVYDEAAKDEREMARLLETPITVTTLDHLCICLTGTREDHHAAFFNLAHSCVVIDEADFYDDFTQANMVLLLEALRLLEVPVLLMSATLPESARHTYQIGTNLPQIVEDTTDHKRPRCNLFRFPEPVIIPADMAPLLTKAIEGEPTVIYVNTVQRAQRLADWLRSQVDDPDTVILYHSRYTEPDKRDIEDRLIKQFGRKAWKDGNAHGIAVLTQIGELSVNISANYMISELCPTDRLTQRVGRLARFPNALGEYPIGELHLVIPSKRNKATEEIQLYPAPYGSYKNGEGWQASEALTASDMQLQNGTYTAADFVRLVNELYPEPPGSSSKAATNTGKLRAHIARNWLIVPKGEVTEDGEETIGPEPWRCRNIDAQATLLVCLSSASGVVVDSSDDIGETVSRYLPNWFEWNALKIKHGVNCYLYELHEAVKEGKVVEARYRIGDNLRNDSEQAWLVRPDFYDAQQGLQLRDPEEDGFRS